jgi:hypothetical protein
MSNYLPGHSLYNAPAVLTKQQQEYNEILENWRVSGKAKRKTLWRIHPLLQTMFDDPNIIKPRVRKYDFKTCPVIDIRFYPGSNTYYIRGFDTRFATQTLVKFLSTESRPIKVSHYKTRADMTDEFLCKILEFKATEAIKSLNLQQIYGLTKNSTFSQSLTVFLSELAIKQD